MALLSDNEKKWQAEDDARTLADAKRIQNDPPRMQAAQDAAKRLANEDQERINAMRQVAGKRKIENSNNNTSNNRSVPKQKTSPIGSKQSKGTQKASKFNVFKTI